MNTRTTSAKAVVLGALITGVALLGTAAPAAAHTTHHAGVRATAGRKLLAIIKTENAAVTRAKAEAGLSGLPAIESAFGGAARRIDAIKFPGSDRADAKALVASLVKLQYDVSRAIAAEGNATELQGIETTVVNDEGTEVSASDALREDLGLPLAKV